MKTTAGHEGQAISVIEADDYFAKGDRAGNVFRVKEEAFDDLIAAAYAQVRTVKRVVIQLSIEDVDGCSYARDALVHLFEAARVPFVAEEQGRCAWSILCLETSSEVQVRLEATLASMRNDC